MSVGTTRISQTFGPIATGVACVINDMKVFTADQIVVYESDGVTECTVDVDYTVSVEADYSGVTVTPLAPLTARETEIVVARKTALTSDFDIAPSGRLSEPRLVEQLDRTLMREQENAEVLGRTLRLPAGEAAASLPSAASRANTVLAFDASGNPSLVTRGREVAPNEITNTELADMAEATFKMRAAGSGAGDPIDGTVAQAQTALALPANTVASLAGKSPTITDQTAVGTLATDDELLVWDVSATAFRKATAQEIADLAGGGTGDVSPYEISGLEITRYDANTFQIQPGGAANSSNDPTEMLRHTTTTNVVLTSTGLNKLDTGAIANYDECYIYLIKNLTTDAIGFVVSKSISYGGVVYPSGYGAAKSRKLRWGIVYRSVGIPSFHYFNGLTHFTDPDVEGGYFWPDGAYNADTAGAWTTINLKPSSGTKILPDNSRMAILWARVDYVSAAGRAYARTPSTSGAGKTVGYVTSNLARVFTGDFFMQTNSTGQIQIKTDAGVKIWISVVGYLQSEYS